MTERRSALPAWVTQSEPGGVGLGEETKGAFQPEDPFGAGTNGGCEGWVVRHRGDDGVDDRLTSSRIDEEGEVGTSSQRCECPVGHAQVGTNAPHGEEIVGDDDPSIAEVLTQPAIDNSCVLELVTEHSYDQK